MTEQAYTIKPLEWRPDTTRANGWIAEAALCTYRVWNTMTWACSVDDGPPIYTYNNGVMFASDVDAKSCCWWHFQWNVSQYLSPVPAAGREIARIEGKIETIGDPPDFGIACGSECSFREQAAYMQCMLQKDDAPGFPSEQCPRYAAPGTTPVEIIVRERATE